MTYPTKPGDTFTARAIGTYPELPEPPFDTKDLDPQFWVEHSFPDDGSHVMTYGGPRGVVAVELKDGRFTHYRDQVGGEVLRCVAWNADTMTWDEVGESQMGKAQ